MDTQVLIVGAGPTGLMFASQLARRGLRPLIIDRHSGPAQQTRAMAVQARTLEIYAKMGLAERALGLGARAGAANLWTNGRWAARIPLGDIGASMSPFPFVLMLGQDDNERIMGESLRELGVEVHWNTELTGFTQHADHVDAVIRTKDEEPRAVRAAWVAGCDGSRSAVRELSGITFPGGPYEQVFFVADAQATGSMKPGELNVYLWRDGFHLFFPMRGADRWRVIGILPKPLRGRDEVGFDALAPSIRQQAGGELQFSACTWFSTYRIHHRAAERFRDRRAFLLGDAAHVHSPVGGQGMNTGLQDAYNLAWKLALVLEGRARPSLLDTYEEERKPVAERLLRTTDQAFLAVVSEGWLGGFFRTRILARLVARAMRLERVRRLAFRAVSQIGIRYRASRLSQTLPGLPRRAPKGGDRFPWVPELFDRLDDRCFSLVVVGQPAAAAEELGFGGMLSIHELAGDAAAFYLLRPDGHVGLAGATLDVQALQRYLDERELNLRPRDTRHAARKPRRR